VQEPSPTPVIYTNGGGSPAVRGYIAPTTSIPVTVTPVNGFTGTVTLQTSNSVTGITTTFSPGTVTLDGVHSQTVNFNLQNPSFEAQPNTDSYTITGVSGSLTEQAPTSASVLVSYPYTITISPTTTQLVGDDEGGSATWTLTVTGLAGYTGSVNLVFSNPDSTDLAGSLSQNTVPLTASKPTQTVTFTVTNKDQVNNGNGGNYTFAITGFSLAYSASVSATEDVEGG
jgi:hypothetical protein